MVKKMQHLRFSTFSHPPLTAAVGALFSSEEMDGDQVRAVRQALSHLLASENFSRAQRMARLITFLIESELRGDTAQLCEYALGIEVFDRDARSYNTCDDPIVRVQMGRLRERLAAYYAHAGAMAAYRFSVPLGSYRPIIARVGARGGGLGEAMLLALVPLMSCDADRQARTVTKGLNEELVNCLCRTFPHRIVREHLVQAPPATSASQRITHVLEGSVRVADGALRLYLRVIDASVGSVCWCEHFDRLGPGDMAVQEDLAHAVCSALQHFFGPDGL
jgi:TolB-like protein